MACRTSAIKSGDPDSRDRRYAALVFENANSVGLNQGQYGGVKTRVWLRCSAARRAGNDLWNATLSAMIILSRGRLAKNEA